MRCAKPRAGVAVESDGNLYVADYGNNTIRAGELPLAVAAAASRKTHTGAGSFDVSLALFGTPSVEPRTGGANGDHTLIFTLNHPLTGGSASVTSGTGSVAGTPGCRAPSCGST